MNNFWKQLLTIVVGQRVILMILIIATFCVCVQGLYSTICGKQGINRYPKIIGGMHAYQGEFPWMVSIKENGQHLCGGVIIHERFVLTAAHCFTGFSYSALGQPVTLVVTLAEHTMRRNSRAEITPSVDVTVKRVIKHPDYNEDSYAHDIALVTLTNTIKWNEYTRPICLPDTTEANVTASGELSFVAGWGLTKEKQSNTEWRSNSVLKMANLTVFNTTECQDYFDRKGVHHKILDTQICAGYLQGGLDTCRGDSGGALMVQRGRQWTTLGIVSIGVGCGRPGFPGLYTRVAKYTHWIRHMTEPKVSSFFNIFPNIRQKQTNKYY